jgi:addiction module RelE/StbE family toxin
MRVRYSPRATEDLELLRQYLAEHSPQAVAQVMASIFAAIEFIRRFPDAAEETRIPGVRGKLVPRNRYRIFYRVLTSEDAVQILHIRHTSRRTWDENHSDEA